MARRRTAGKKQEVRDARYDSPLVGKLISKVMKDGKCVDKVDAEEGEAGFKVMADQLEELSKHAGNLMDKVGLNDVMSKVSNMVKLN